MLKRILSVFFAVLVIVSISSMAFARAGGGSNSGSTGSRTTTNTRSTPAPSAPAPAAKAPSGGGQTFTRDNSVKEAAPSGQTFTRDNSVQSAAPAPKAAAPSGQTFTRDNSVQSAAPAAPAAPAAKALPYGKPATTGAARTSEVDKRLDEKVKAAGEPRNRADAATAMKDRKAYERRYDTEPSVRPAEIPRSTRYHGRKVNIYFNPSYHGYGFMENGVWMPYQPVPYYARFGFFDFILAVVLLGVIAYAIYKAFGGRRL